MEDVELHLLGGDATSLHVGGERTLHVHILLRHVIVHHILILIVIRIVHHELGRD